MENPALRDGLQLLDLRPDRGMIHTEVLEGLSATPRSVPCKFLYDARGSELFDQICELDEYYLTRTEISIMEEHAAEIVDCLGSRCLLVEYGSGSSIKTRILLDSLHDISGYVPIDISRDYLIGSASALSDDYPNIQILPVCADYMQSIRLPRPSRPANRIVVYFPGSTIGNFEADEARSFLRRVADVCGRGGGLLIGVDLQKERSVLEAAYNDSQGVTAEFNKNILHRMNREISSAIDPDAFEHNAVYNAKEGRVEMYLVSRSRQTVRVDGHHLDFRAGESICTEYSYKYTLDGFADLAAAAGFRVEAVWTDPQEFFSVQYLVAK